ncbi:MAG TPA: hypothetical protein VFH68_00580 [Polyangia bacterium]|jgi:hypothetical protein|nr:hypothetical protein [Polyangia bacterium]
MTLKLRFSLLVVSGMLVAGCGTPDAVVVDSGPNFGSTIPMAAPELLDASAPACSEPHTVCLTVKMPDTIPGPPTHLAVGYYKAVPVMTPAAARGVLQSPPLVAGQQFRLKVQDGTLTGDFYPVVLVYMPGGGDIIAVDNLDYTAEATTTYNFNGDALNVPELMHLVYGI